MKDSAASAMEIQHLKSLAMHQTLSLPTYITHLQMNFSAGGIGSAPWDASVILSNFILENSHHFKGATVHEVGAGVGLPGIVAARYCRRAIMSDYVPILIDNMNYNIKLNQCKALGEEPQKYWDMECDGAQSQGYEDIVMPEVRKQVAEKQAETGKLDHDWRNPGFIMPDRELIEQNRHNMSVNVSRSAVAYMLDWLDFAKLPQEEKNKFKCDIILGSEVSYSQIQDTLASLLNLVNETLSPTGAVYFIQSPDRGTQDEMVAGMEANGFICTIRDVPERILQYYATGQRYERYLYYTFRRPASHYPIMGETSDKDEL